MTIEQAYDILQHHAEWRQDKRSEMMNPKLLTEALDVVLKYLEKKLSKKSYATV